mmetsp:Transcript_12446/g.17274  ORF Transcript_12446/g.17274 Transcript_12446/m.17274 type:complete len:166 (+) Transcript_12446:191-688(+)|eukprot:CAMPEP_0184482958 /NCGR_PEP_ID=MMETSP0113_2-20130426/4561_1 /TAXON_ID=91329 /ORGANISM="Norrisiella sphaerica, Strain BC52" /LENGTH=165 /DNA_ID=CAMNT_0026863027 /DNA_START=239 /DNA_END=736 /DNA_ORIENTATION=+
MADLVPDRDPSYRLIKTLEGSSSVDQAYELLSDTKSLPKWHPGVGNVLALKEEKAAGCSEQLLIVDKLSYCCCCTTELRLKTTVEKNDRKKEIVFVVPRAPGGVFVAHRYSVIENAGKVVVLDDVWIRANPFIRWYVLWTARASHQKVLDAFEKRLQITHEASLR